MPYHVHDKLVHASELLGATLNQFIIQSALEKAQLILEQERVLNITQKDAEIFLKRIEMIIKEHYDELTNAWQKHFRSGSY